MQFFRFVLALRQEEHSKCAEMDKYIQSGGLRGAKQKKINKVSAQRDYANICMEFPIKLIVQIEMESGN